MSELEKMSTAALCDEIARLDVAATPAPWQSRFIYRALSSTRRHARRLGLSFLGDGSKDWTDSDLCARYRTLAPEAARRLRERDDELKEIATALDLGPGELIEGEILEAIEALQEQARRAAELEQRLALLKCDAGRAAGGAS